MPISFERVPFNLRAPGIYAEFSNRDAIQGLALMPQTILVVGQRLSTGTVGPLVPTRVSSESEAKTFFGQGSMLHAMFVALKANNRFTDTWAIALDDNGAGVSATGSINFSGTITGAGTLNVYIAGIRVQLAVTTSSTPASVATSLISLINADLNLPVSASSGGSGIVSLAANHKGEVGNDIDVRVSYYDDESLPAGLAAAVTAMSGGTGNPSTAPAIDAMGDDWYTMIALPYTDSANLALIKAELDDRWGPIRQIDGRAFAARRGTFGGLGTFGDAQNDPHLAVMGLPACPTPSYQWAGAIAGVVADAGGRDPARPFQTLELKGVLGPKPLDRFTLQERNLLLYDGVSTFTVDADGTVRIERLITTYQRNSSGLPDTSYLDVTTLLTLSYLRFSFRARFAQKFPRHKIANDGTNFGPGQAVVTPKILRGEAIALFVEWEQAGLVENIEQFKRDILVERNADDPNRADLLLPPDLVNQLIVTAAQIGFRL